MIDSPCVNVCRMDSEIGLCAGCLRTLDEIARWSIMQDGERARVVAVTAERRIRFSRAPDAPGHATSDTETDPPRAHNLPDRR